MLFCLALACHLVAADLPGTRDGAGGSDCVAYASTLCDADPGCHAFGLHSDKVQLHGCNSTVANKDWVIYSKETDAATASGYVRLPGTQNVDESKCAHHPHSGIGPYACPERPATPKPYTVLGSYEVGTLENSLFSWHGTLYLLENINGDYAGNAGVWFPEYQGHSYARIRRFDNGIVVCNISSSIGYGFLSAYPDYEHDRVWLFGTNHDRGGKGPQGGYPCSGQTVTAWWSAGGEDLTSWGRACTDAVSADNVEVASVALPPHTLPAHTHVMSDECPGFRIINAPADGNLTKGWNIAPGSTAGPCGGPSTRWTVDPKNRSAGYYYRITGGHHVMLARSRDLRDPWQSTTMIEPTKPDANVAPFAGFPQTWKSKGFELNLDNWQAWDRNSNDADVCCMDPLVNGSYVIWGASTQGGAPKPPVPRNQSQTNAVGTSPQKLAELLDAFFPLPLPYL